MIDIGELMTTPVNRRRLLEIGGALGLAGLAAKVLPLSALAQANPDNSGGYPELNVTIEDEGIKVPDQVPAGLTFITLKNASSNGDLVVAWGRLADGVAKAEVEAAFAAPVPATPTNDDPVTALLKAKKILLVGGPQAPAPDLTSAGIVKLTEGIHVLLDVFTNRAVFFEVGPAGPDAKTEEPRPEVTVKLGNMVFVGLDQGVPAGKHVWQVENIDTMEHELIVAPLEPGMTADDFKAVLEQFTGEGSGATPPAGATGTQPPAAGGDEGDQPNGGASIMSSGEKTWQVIDLPAGHYAAFCMVPMDWSGPPHALMGMIKVFDAK